jgi:O-antigen ligase
VEVSHCPRFLPFSYARLTASLRNAEDLQILSVSFSTVVVTDGERLKKTSKRFKPFWRVLLFIGLFATFHGAQNRSAAYRVLLALSAFKFALGTVPQYHPHATERIATLGFAQQRMIDYYIF